MGQHSWSSGRPGWYRSLSLMCIFVLIPMFVSCWPCPRWTMILGTKALSLRPAMGHQDDIPHIEPFSAAVDFYCIIMPIPIFSFDNIPMNFKRMISLLLVNTASHLECGSLKSKRENTLHVDIAYKCIHHARTQRSTWSFLIWETWFIIGHIMKYDLFVCI